MNATGKAPDRLRMAAQSMFLALYCLLFAKEYTQKPAPRAGFLWRHRHNQGAIPPNYTQKTLENTI